MRTTMGEATGWRSFAGGASSGEIGSEDGCIVADAEEPRGTRITLERATRTAPFAVTCGVYGWMVHTRFFADEAKARWAYTAMRAGLTDLLDQIEAAGDTDKEWQLRVVTAAIGDFVRRFP